MSDLFSELPVYLSWHLFLAACAMGIGIVVSVPLGIWASKRPMFAEYLLGVAGILQTVPTLALLAIMVPILNAIGFLPAFVALTLYSFLPILAATVTGLRGVDPSLIEAARGLGMSERQMLFRVQLPLASAVILSGIRTATVLVIGTATLATPVGGKSLGNYIFGGLNMQNWDSVVFGCIFTALLAVALDQLVHMLEIANARRSKRLAWIALGILLISVSASAAAPIASLLRADLIVVSGPFSEQFILGQVMKQWLEKNDFKVDQRDGVGETIQVMGLKRGKADIAINYTGNVWTTMMNKTEFQSSDVMYAEVCEHLWRKHDIKCLGKIGFQNNYVFAIRDKPEFKNIKDLRDLGPYLSKLRFADDEMFFARPEWANVRSRYEFKDEKPRNLRSMDVGLLYSAAESNKADVITAYSSDARIKGSGLRELTDSMHALPEYDAILLVSKQTWDRMQTDYQLKEALDQLVGSIDIKQMKDANGLVDINKQTPVFAARKLLQELTAFKRHL